MLLEQIVPYAPYSVFALVLVPYLAYNYIPGVAWIVKYVGIISRDNYIAPFLYWGKDYDWSLPPIFALLFIGVCGWIVMDFLMNRLPLHVCSANTCSPCLFGRGQLFPLRCGHSYKRCLNCVIKMNILQCMCWITLTMAGGVFFLSYGVKTPPATPHIMYLLHVLFIPAIPLLAVFHVVWAGSSWFAHNVAYKNREDELAATIQFIASYQPGMVSKYPVSDPNRERNDNSYYYWNQLIATSAVVTALYLLPEILPAPVVHLLKMESGGRWEMHWNAVYLAINTIWCYFWVWN